MQGKRRTARLATLAPGGFNGLEGPAARRSGTSSAPAPAAPGPAQGGDAAEGGLRDDDRTESGGTGLLRKILDSYLSELRQEIAATKRNTSPRHDEENLIKGLQQKLS
jgi:hypothetical protein